MESAIPHHLRRARTCPSRAAADHIPGFPSTVARFKPTTHRVAMAYFGVQYPRTVGRDIPDTATLALEHSMLTAEGPGHWDRASYVDEVGYRNDLRIGYWDDVDTFDRWFAQHGGAWTDAFPSHASIGAFTEVLRPTVERFETLFSSNQPEGIANLAASLSGAIKEHGYWGGARDRIPLTQTDSLVPAGQARIVRRGAKLQVIPNDNACLIRSGQDWSSTTGDERRMYIEDVEPVLRAGMEFLRDQGRDVECFCNRYVRIVDANNCETEKSFGMSWWKSLAALEAWAESHPTHMRIFAVAMKYLGALGADAQLRLYHEVSVAKAEEQFFEYCNCHAKTGMLNGFISPPLSLSNLA